MFLVKTPYSFDVFFHRVALRSWQCWMRVDNRISINQSIHLNFHTNVCPRQVINNISGVFWSILCKLSLTRYASHFCLISNNCYTHALDFSRLNGWSRYILSAFVSFWVLMYLLWTKSCPHCQRNSDCICELQVFRGRPSNAAIKYTVDIVPSYQYLHPAEISEIYLHWSKTHLS